MPAPRAAGHVDGGFTLIELLIIVAILGILAATVAFFIQGVTPRSARSACEADARTVTIAASEYLSENPTLAQVTEAQLTNQSTGTLQEWPTGAGGAYTIVIAGDGNGLVGQTDADGNVIAENDVLVNVGAKYYDATAGLPAACASA